MGEERPREEHAAVESRGGGRKPVANLWILTLVGGRLHMVKKCVRRNIWEVVMDMAL